MKRVRASIFRRSGGRTAASLPKLISPVEFRKIQSHDIEPFALLPRGDKDASLIRNLTYLKAHASIAKLFERDRIICCARQLVRVFTEWSMNEQRDIWQDRASTVRLSGLRMADRCDINCCSEGKNEAACCDHVLRKFRRRRHRIDIWRSRSPYPDRSQTHCRRSPYGVDTARHVENTVSRRDLQMKIARL